MRAVVCREYGAPEDLVLDEVPDPIPGPGQVVVRVRAAAVNYPDVLLIAGKYQIKVPPPFSPGSEMAGDVLAVGDGVDLQPGDRIMPGRASNYGTRRASNSVYRSATLDAATWGAELAVGEGRGRIYIVEPTGAIATGSLAANRMPFTPLVM